MRAALVGAGAAVALVAAACTSGGTHVTASTRTTSAVPVTATPPPIAPDLAPATTMYYSPPRASSSIFERALHGSGPTGRRIGRANDYVVTPGQAPGAVGTFEWYSSRTGRETLISPGEPPAAWHERPMPHRESADDSCCALALDGRYYRQRGHHVVALIGDRIVARYRLPALRAERWAVRRGFARRGARLNGQVGALVPTSSGHVLAFIFTGVAAAVTDLMTGRTVAIPDFGVVDTAVRTASGDLLLVVDRLTYHDIDLGGYSSQHVLRLNTQLRVLANIATGMPAHHSFSGTSTLLPGLGHDAVLAIDDRSADENPNPHLHIWTVDGDRLARVRTIPSPTGFGLAPDDPHRVFVYNEKRVGVLDIATGAYRPNVRRLDAPRGSDIEAIV